jgi:hypothetical protein
MSDTRARIVEQLIERLEDAADEMYRQRCHSWAALVRESVAALRDLPAREGQEEKREKRKCPDCGEMCAHPWCGRCERVLPPVEHPHD